MKYKQVFETIHCETYGSNFEILLRAVKITEYQVRKAQSVNIEDNGFCRLVQTLFKEISLHGLKIQYYCGGNLKPQRVVYTPTLSVLKTKRGAN